MTLPDLLQDAGLAHQRPDLVEQPFPGQFAVGHQAARPGPRQHLGIPRLVVVGGVREGNEDRRPSRRRDFGHRAGAGPAHHHVRRRKGPRHVVDERHHFALHPTGGKLTRDCGVRLPPGLVDQPHPETRVPKQPPALPYGIVQGPRALAAARDEHRERIPARFRRDLEELRAYRYADQLGSAAREVARGLLEVHQRPPGPPRHPAVGHSRHRVGLHHRQRNPPHPRRQHRRARGVPAHAEHRRRLPARQRHGDPRRSHRQLPQRARRLHQPHALQPADLDELDRKAGRRDQFRLQTRRRSDKERLVPTPLQLPRHGQRRDNVAPGAAPGH